MTSDPTPGTPGGSIGTYRIVRTLGAGGMGEVYLAYDDRLDRQVAIKRIRSGGEFDPAQRERLRREARAAAALSHPSIVQVYDIIEAADGDSIVMEYVEGRTLTSLLEEGALDSRSALQVLLQVVDGLHAAHAKLLVHRDLKSENVVIAEDGSAKILDFGVAKSSDPGHADASLTVGALAVGTYRSMSPEQCEVKPVDARSDLFSLGVLMYEMFGGRTPFLGRTPLHTMANVVGYDPPRLGDLNRSLPPALSDLVSELLAKDPAERPASAAAVADRLEALDDSTHWAGIVMPRLTPAPDSGVDPIKTLDQHSRHGDSVTRRRRPASPRATLRRPSLVRRWTALLGLGVVAVGAAFLISKVGAADPEGPTRIMVFPLVSSAGAAGTASLGEDVATVIGHALDGIEPLQWLDGWPLLGVEARNDPRGLELTQMADLARSKGCRYFLWGRVVQTGDSARVYLDLHETRRGDALARADAGVALEDAWRAGLRAVNGLLPRLIETEIPDVEADFGGRPTEAVARFLLGEAALRRARYSDALNRFEEAFATDSTFALAGIRGAQAASWLHRPEAAAEMLGQVLLLPLESRARHFARGVLAFVQADAEGAVESLGAAISEDSTFAVAWAQLGETYRHLIPRMALRGPSPFTRAEQLDSLAGYVLFHRLEELIREGDLERARQARDRFQSGAPDPNLLAQIDMMYRCVDAGPASQDWSRDLAAWPWEMLYAAAQLGMAGRQLPCAEAFYREILVHDTLADPQSGERFWNATVGLSSSLLARGETEGGRRLLEAAALGFPTFQSLVDRSSAGPGGVSFPSGEQPWTRSPASWHDVRSAQLLRWSELMVLVGFAHPELSDLGDRGADDLRALAGPQMLDLPYRTSIWLIGLWGARHGRPEEAALAATRLREIALTSESPADRPYTERMADALDAHRLLAQGDSAGALTSFRQIRANTIPGIAYWELVPPFAVERLVRGRLEARLGDPAAALSLALGFEGANAQTHLLYLPAGLDLCRSVADRARQLQEGARCAGRLDELGWTETPDVFR